MTTYPDLSVVVIARNEAENIKRTIESILRGIARWPQTEVILVDSASTDGTVEIARQYPIQIVRLKPSWFLSAAAGRYIGMLQARGEFILYLDGDMELVTGWLEQAIPFIRESPELAGVSGYRRDISIQAGQVVAEQDVGRTRRGNPIEVRHFGGAALYRRSALEKVGGFNPYIISDEEPELCLRLRHAGYKLVRLPYLIVKNYTLPMNSWDYFVRRFKTRLLLGRGQMLRYHLRTGLFWPAFRERALDIPLFAGGFLMVSAVVLLALIFQRLWILGIFVALVGIVVAFYWLKKRSLQKLGLSMIGRLFIVYGIVRGFLIEPKSPADYPTEVERILPAAPVKILDDLKLGTL